MRCLTTMLPIASRKRLLISTSITKAFTVPLTLTDVYLRDEQLPFAYIFRETLSPKSLIRSLREIVKRYPLLGAKTNLRVGKTPTLDCNVCDTVPMSFGRSDSSLEKWLEEKRSGKMQHAGWKSGGGSPKLSPLFDDLMSNKWIDRIGNADSVEEKGHKVATFRITHFDGGGTAVGINISHLLGDASSCIRIAESWGREMRGLAHPLRASDKRVDATLTGMVSPDMVEFLNLDDTMKREK